MDHSCDIAWLPEFVAFDGVWDTYVETLYSHFCADFMTSKPTFRGRAVSAPWRKDHAYQEKSGTFWHLVSKGDVEEERELDFRRCERIRWPRKLIEACDEPVVHTWTDDSRGDPRWKLALSDYSYLVVLADHRKYLTLVSAYPVKGPRQREKLSDEHALCRSSGATPKSSKPPPSR